MSLLMKITKAFGNSVREIRLELSLSQEELAEKCGLHRTYVGSVERGERNITLINADKIANALNVSLAEILENGNFDK